MAIAQNLLPQVQQVRIDGYVLTVTLLLSILTGIIFSLVPALQVVKSDPNDVLKESGRGSHSAVGRRLRSAFVIVEIALSLVLLIGAGLLLQSFVRLRQIDPGFSPNNVLTVGVDLPSSKYEEDAQTVSFFQRLLTQIQTQRGIRYAGLTTALPMAGGMWENQITLDGPSQTDNEIPVDWLVVSPDYFKAMSIPLIQGLFFTERDDANKPAVVIVDEMLASRFFGSPADALGKRLTLNKRTQPSEIVGVVRHVKYSGVAEQSRVTVYEANGQFPVQSVYLAIQTTEDPLTAATIVRNEVLALDKDQPITEVRSMDQIVEDSTASRKLTMFLLNTFSALALILAAAGLYAVVSYTTSQRTREIAIRVALGAKYRDVLKLVVTQGMVLAVFGIGLGLVLALALTRLMAGLLFGIGSTDAATFIGLSLFLILVTFAACYVPARKATKIDPMIVLRDE